MRASAWDDVNHPLAVFHTRKMCIRDRLYLAGILLGIAAGFFELIRAVVRDTK